ncbi:hypothetical protein SCUP515_02941 [Seiridium cupressi]
MSVTPEQLKNLPVSYYVSSWRSNGTTVTMQEMMRQTFRFDPNYSAEKDDGGGEIQSQPRELYLSIQNSDLYLRIRCDDSAPKDAELHAHYADLKDFILKNPDVVAAMFPLLDQDIERRGLIEGADSKPLARLNMKEKLQLLARHQLQLAEISLPPESTKETKLKVCLLKITGPDKTEFEFHEATISGKQGEHEGFLAWLNSIATPKCAAITNYDAYDCMQSIWDPPSPASLQRLMSMPWPPETSSQDCTRWSYKKLVNKGKTAELTGNWGGLET